jgi:dsRNA-specific ribonuclease
VSIAGKPWGTGEGSSKKQAEQAAAQVALIALNEELSDLSEFEKEEADA